MKALGKIMAIAAVVLSSGTVQAQNLRMTRTGDVVRADGTREYVIPATTIAVDVTVKKETIRTGPYSRFAQRYFGAIAPLSDKDIFTIEDARIGWYDDPAQAGPALESLTAAPAAVLNPNDWSEFPRVLPDKISSANKTLEESAREAAQRIFDIRKRRYELISGDYAETVFGEGLSTALERLDKMEAEYMELFYGKHTLSYETRRFHITPDVTNRVYVICRWNENRGLLPDDDLSGQPVLLELKPQGKAGSTFSAPQDTRKGKDTAPKAMYAVADNVSCRVTEGKRELAVRTVPIYQFGVLVSLDIK